MTNVNDFIAEISAISADVESRFGGLTGDQLNWRPSADSWSVGQCFEHLILTNDEITKPVGAVAAGAHANSFWENWSPFTGFFGNFLMKSMVNDRKQFKVPSKTIVPPSAVDPEIISKFLANNAALSDLIRKIDGVDLAKTVITSPFMGLMTYRLGDGMTIVVEHEKRHIRQAERVMATEGYPR